MQTPKDEAKTRTTRRSAVQFETPSNDTPTRRTRRTSALHEESLTDSPRVTRLGRKSNVKEEVETITPRRSRRGSAEPEYLPTPVRITRRRSPSVQSIEGIIPQSIVKTPLEPTIMEDDNFQEDTTNENEKNTKSPSHNTSNSLKTTLNREEQQLEEKSASPSRPITRSMSQSPASPNKKLDIEKTQKTYSNEEIAKIDKLENKMDEKVFKDKTTETNDKTGKKKSDIFSKSWSQPVIFGPLEPIDKFNVSKLNKSDGNLPAENKSPLKKRLVKPICVSSSSSGSSNDEDSLNDIVNDEAKEIENYESGDSLDEETKMDIDETDKQIDAQGIDLGSEDSEIQEESDEYEKGSFIASDEDVNLLSYSDDDEHIDSKVLSNDKKRISRIRAISSSSDSTDAEEKQLPKIRLHKKLSTGDADISFKPTEITIFDSNATKFSNSLMILDEENETNLSIASSSSKKQKLNLEVIDMNNSTAKSKEILTLHSHSFDKDVNNQINDDSNKTNDGKIIGSKEIENTENEAAKKKNKVNVNELGQKFRESQLNSLAVANSPERLKVILERCETTLAEKEAIKKKNLCLHKKNKEKKRKADSDKKCIDDNNEEESTKKKKKQKIGRIYNKELLNGDTDSANEKLKQKLEAIEKKRAKNREKKIAKKSRAQSSGEILLQKLNNDKINSNVEALKTEVTHQSKKKKTNITAFEAKNIILQPSHLMFSEKQSNQKANKINNDGKETIATKTNEKSINNSVKSGINKENKLLKIFTGFSEIPVTPESVKIKRNRGFIEEPLTPRPIGFKVSSILPHNQEYIQQKTKKRKRTPTDIEEPSKLRPKPIWSASGKFEEIDTFEKNYSVNANANTEFKLGILNQPPIKKRYIDPLTQHGLSTFKTKAMYSQNSQRQSSKALLRQKEKEKLLKKGKGVQIK